MRQVNPDDAPELARLIRAVWAHHNLDPVWIARVSLESNHATLVATAPDAADTSDLIGFVDAFSTIAPDGVFRWELDLLGVHPAWRSRGVAQCLINRVTELGHERGTQIARALVRTDNLASQTAFQRCGFVAVPLVHSLYPDC